MTNGHRVQKMPRIETTIIRSFLYTSGWLVVLFSVVFYGVDYFTTLRDNYFGLYLAWEQQIPYVPQAYPVYYSIIFLPFFVPVYVKSADLIQAWGIRMAACVVVAAVFFLLFPAKLGYPPTSDPAWELVEEITPFIVGRHNLMPSLHVAFTCVIVATLWPHQQDFERAVFVIWAFLLSLSTLLTHAHHVLDVLAGLLLGFLAHRYTGMLSDGLKRHTEE